VSQPLYVACLLTQGAYRASFRHIRNEVRSIAVLGCGHGIDFANKFFGKGDGDLRHTWGTIKFTGALRFFSHKKGTLSNHDDEGNLIIRQR
jgi:hypothetical protein